MAIILNNSLQKKILCCYIFVWIQFHLTCKAWGWRMYETVSSLYVLILFDPVVCIICSTIVLSTLFTLLILALVIIDYCFFPFLLYIYTYIYYIYYINIYIYISYTYTYIYNIYIYIIYIYIYVWFSCNHFWVIL